jgi:hypothetical protein
MLRIFFQDRTILCNIFFLHFGINYTLHRFHSLGVVESRWASLGVDSSRFKIGSRLSQFGLFGVYNRLFWGFI